MADNTINYGFPYPQGGDRVAVHTDVENLAKAVDALVQRVEAASLNGMYYRGNVGEGETLDSLAPGAHWIPSGGIAEALGVPGGLQGSLIIAPGDGSENLKSAIYIARDNPPRMYVAQKFSYGWTEWMPLGGSAGPGASSRTAAVALNHSRGTDDIDPRRLVNARIPVKLGADVQRVRAAFRNYDARTRVTYPGEFQILGVAFGRHKVGPDGSLTGQFDGEPTILRHGFVMPADGRTESTGWTDVEMEAGVEYLLSYAYEAPEGVTIARQAGWCWSNQIRYAWNSPNEVTALPQSFSPLLVHLEVETSADTPVYAYLGDSQTAATGTAMPRYDSWADRHAFLAGAIPQVYAWPGSRLNEWDDPDDAIWRRFAHLDKPDRLYIQLGSNDLADETMTLPTMQARLAATAEVAMSYTSTNLHLVQLFPRATPQATYPVRRAYNDWLVRTLPSGATAAHETFGALIDPATGLTSERWKAGLEDSHLTTAGNARVAVLLQGGAIPEEAEPSSVTYVGDGVYEIS